MSDREKIFSEQEATDLMLRAAQLQEEAPEAEGDKYVPGLTLNELKRMAKELGVEEKYLMRALESEGDYRTVTDPDKKTSGDFLGIPWVREYEAVLDGELPPDHFDIVMEDLSSHSGRGGKGFSHVSMQVGRTVQGVMSAGLGHGRFTMTSRNGRTRMKVRSNAFIPFMAVGYPLFLAGIIVAAVMGESKVMPGGVVAAFLGMVFVLAVLVSGALSNIGHRNLKARFERLVQKVDEESANLRENLSSAGAGEEVREGRVEISDRLGE